MWQPSDMKTVKLTDGEKNTLWGGRCRSTHKISLERFMVRLNNPVEKKSYLLHSAPEANE